MLVGIPLEARLGFGADSASMAALYFGRRIGPPAVSCWFIGNQQIDDSVVGTPTVAQCSATLENDITKRSKSDNQFSKLVRSWRDTKFSEMSLDLYEVNEGSVSTAAGPHDCIGQRWTGTSSDDFLQYCFAATKCMYEKDVWSSKTRKALKESTVVLRHPNLI